MQAVCEQRNPESDAAHPGAANSGPSAWQDRILIFRLGKNPEGISMTTGTIISVRKGYCFVDTVQRHGIYAHQSAFDKAVLFGEHLIGREVTLEFEQGPRGLRAKKVWLAADWNECKFP